GRVRFGSVDGDDELADRAGDEVFEGVSGLFQVVDPLHGDGGVAFGLVMGESVEGCGGRLGVYGHDPDALDGDLGGVLHDRGDEHAAGSDGCGDGGGV